jgi:hypothetical protein
MRLEAMAAHDGLYTVFEWQLAFNAERHSLLS